MSSQSFEVEATDVIKVILQFLKEQGLYETFHQLQREVHISLNVVDNVENLVSDVQNGRWDVVLPQIAQLQLPRVLLEDLYELIVIELLQLREIDTARALIRQTQVFQMMKKDNGERYLMLERLCGRTFFDPKEAYGNNPREKRRALISHQIAQQVTVVPPSRLMNLLGDGLKWQYSKGILPRGKPDIFRGTIYGQHDEEETYPTQMSNKITLNENVSPECATYSPDGSALVTGSADGYIEVWDPLTAKLRDLSYQLEDNFMVHNSAVLSVAFSANGEVLASGDKEGQIKVWRFKSGVCLKRFDAAHTDAVNCIAVSKEGTQILSGGFDGVVRVHGLKSGKLIKEFRGHRSIINSVSYLPDASQIVSSSSDATVVVWEYKTGDAISSFKLGSESSVIQVLSYPLNLGYLVVCTQSGEVFTTTLQGQIVKSFTTGRKDGCTFVGMCISPKGEHIYCLTDDEVLYCFSSTKGTLESFVEGTKSNAIGVCHHPHRNQVAVQALENKIGCVKLWTP